VLVTYGCGRKTSPIPPELVAPQALGRLTAANASDGIMLSWERPRQREAGTHLDDLGGFRVLRSTDSGPFELVATLDVTDRDRFRQIQKFHYLDAGVTMDVTYRYSVRSATLDGYVSEDSNVVTITREFPPRTTPTAVETAPSG